MRAAAPFTWTSTASRYVHSYLEDAGVFEMIWHFLQLKNGDRFASGGLEQISTASPNLEAGRVIACFCVDAQTRKPLRCAQLDLDLAPAGVVGLITRVVT